MKDSALSDALTRAISAMQGMSQPEVGRLSLFDCTLILGALPHNKACEDVRKRISQRLNDQLSPSWIVKGDACEVFSVLTTLLQNHADYVTGEYLACAVQRLVASQVHVGGPYYAGDTVTITANIQISLFVRLIAKPLPNVEALLADAIADKSFENTELATQYVLYLLARASTNPELAHYVRQHWLQNSWQTPQHVAIALTILKSEEAPALAIDTALSWLCEQQKHSGFWIDEPLVKKQARRQSRYVTTALVIEALTQYEHAQVESLPRRRLVVTAAKHMFEGFSEPLRSSAFTMIDRVARADMNGEITLLPQIFSSALTAQAQITRHQCTTLGLASLYGWIAYTVYDDFLDQEGTPAQLPIANIAMRASIDCFRDALPDQANFQQYVSSVFAAMDEANAWEVHYCRFATQGGKIIIYELPKYGACTVLASRSFAHALAPMAVLAQQSLLPSNPQAHLVERAFRHYLIARQLNDDLRDWKDDIKSGQASYVVTAILRDMHVKHGEYAFLALLPAMQKRFRRTTMQFVCQRILAHVSMSRQAFVKSKLLRDSNDIYQLLDNLEISVGRSLRRQSKTLAFSAVYNQVKR